jgi:hypothetical protein
VKHDQEEYWIHFLPEFEGKKYNGTIIGSQPMRAVSFESAYQMVLEGKALEVKPPKKAKEKTK